MSAVHSSTHEQPLDATLEAAWLNHPCSPLDSTAVAEKYLSAHSATATHDLVFARLIAASSAVRVADLHGSRVHFRKACAALAELAPPSMQRSAQQLSLQLMPHLTHNVMQNDAHRDVQAQPTYRRLVQLSHGVQGAMHWVERNLIESMASFGLALGESDALEPSDEHYIRLWRAVTLLGLGKPDLAFRDLLLALEFFRHHYPPAHALLAFNVGATLVHAGDWEGAESCIRIALRESGLVGMPGFETTCRSNLAYCLINTGRVDEATAEIKTALMRDRAGLLHYRPGDVMTTVAENLIETGHLEEASHYVFAALDDAIGRKYSMGIGTAKWNQGRIAVEQNKAAEAVSAWSVALWNLRRHPHLTQFWKTALAVSTLYSDGGDYRRALRWHRRFHASYRRWLDTTRDVRLAYSQAALQMAAMQRERDAAEAEKLHLLQAKTELEAVNTELQSRFTQIEAIHDELREQASRDLLTGLLNRRSLLPTLDAMLKKSALITQHAIVAMLDLDHFKQFNDRHGHAAGDQILAAAGQLLREFFRDEDSAFRYGGDEFCIFLPHTNRMVGEARLDAFAQALHDTLPRAPDGSASGVTVSFGLACFPDDSLRADELLATADAALYTIKRRNKEAASSPLSRRL